MICNELKVIYLQIDVDCVEDDHNVITEEESFIANALNRLDVR